MNVPPQSYTLIRTFATEKQYLLYGHFYPSDKLHISYVMFGIFMFVYSWTEFFSMAAVLIVEKDNLTKLSETLLFCMTQAAFLCKLTNFIFHKKDMKNIEELLKNPILNDLDQDEQEILESYMVQFKYLSRIYRLLCFLVVILYGMFPFIDDDPDHMLALPGWFPFVDVEKYQQEIVLAQMLGIGIGAFNNSTLDLLAAILITLGSAQFDILSNKLQSITKIKENLKSSMAEKALSSCVIYHTALLNYIDKIEKLFNNGIFVQFAASVLVICLTGFQMLVISLKSIQFVLLMTYFSTMTFQIALYCWYGNELMYRSTGVPEACYLSDWNACSSKVCRSIFIIMERSKRPVVLTAGKLFTLSLTTLMMILKSSYSYFAVLQRLYSKD